MRSRTTWILVMFSWMVVMLSVQIDASCVCNEKGIDYCRSCNELRIVRPKQPIIENPEIDLPPIGDNCWCSKMLIEPAVLPKPPCPKSKPPVPPCGCKTAPSCGCSEPSYHLLPSPNYIPKAKDLSPPADPISVSLAIQAGKAIQVPEAKLAYGFVVKPVDGLKKIYFSDVPEENLYKLKSDVITLKKRLYVPKKEEESIEIEEEEEPPHDYDEPPKLTYKQLGYEIEKFKNPRFRRIYSPYVSSSEENVPKGPKVKVDCGFKPGRIIPYRKLKNSEDCLEKA